MNLMKNLNKNIRDLPQEDHPHSESVLEDFFFHSLKEMYYTECEIDKEFALITNQIISLNLKKILENHYAILLKHKIRLEKIFRFKDEIIDVKNCVTFNALLSEGKKQLAVFTNDPVNWEIALILVAQKLAHYKIASYGGLAHLAIKLNYHKAATLLAVSAQEEEEFIANHLNRIFDAFLASHVEEYKN